MFHVGFTRGVMSFTLQNVFVFSAKGSSRTYFPTQGVRGGYDSYPDDHRPVSTVLSGRRRARCDPGGGTGLGRDTFRQVRAET